MIEIAMARRKRLQDRQEFLHRRHARLDMVRRLLSSKRALYENLRSRMEQLGRLRVNMETKIFARRIMLLKQLETIYPIELVDGAILLFSIVGIPLANYDQNRQGLSNKEALKQDDVAISSALGMIAQMVSLMSVYLDAPLHYPIATAGSRSVIQDGISVMSGPRA